MWQPKLMFLFYTSSGSRVPALFLVASCESELLGRACCSGEPAFPPWQCLPLKSHLAADAPVLVPSHGQCVEGRTAQARPSPL